MIWGASALIALLSTAQAAPRPYLIQEYKDFADGRTTAEALLNVRDQMVAPGEMLLRKIISNVDTARGLYQGNDMRHNTQTRKLKVRTSGFAYLDTFSDATCSARTIQSGVRLGRCHYDDALSDSYLLQCDDSGEKGVLKTYYYANKDCSGPSTLYAMDTTLTECVASDDDDDTAQAFSIHCTNSDAPWKLLGDSVLNAGYDSKSSCSNGSSNMIQYTALATGRAFGNNADIASCDDESYTLTFSEGQGDGSAVFDYTQFYGYTNCEDGDDDGADIYVSTDVIAESIACVSKYADSSNSDDDDESIIVIGGIAYFVGRLFGLA